MPSPSSTASPAAQALWGLVGNTVVEFGSSQIASGTVTPKHQFSLTDPNAFIYTSMAFDGIGNIWIGESENTGGTESGRILEFTAAQLAALATKPNPAPHETLTFGAVVYGLAFDASGKLWASMFSSASDTLSAFTAAQLASGSGSPTPAITVTVQSTGAIAFAADGTLFNAPITVFGPAAGIIYGFAPAQLAASGPQAASYILTPSGSPTIESGQEAIILPPNQLGFDPSGNLWSICNGYTFAFAASTLHAANAPTMTSFQGYAAPTNAGGPTTVVPGYALAFDSAGNLIENSPTNSLQEYTPSQYASGAPMPISATFASSVPTGVSGRGNFLIAQPVVK